jgi:hypothetical protein
VTAKQDCCVGEPCMGDPRGLHSLDCPVYLASMDALEARTQPRRVELEPDTLSTSARLRQVEQQRDQACALSVELLRDTERLREVERERDELAIRASDLEQVRGELQQLRLLADGYLEDIQQLESGRDELIDSLRAQRNDARVARDGLAELYATARSQQTLTDAELASARQELAKARELIAVHEQLEAVRDWVVARDGGRYCERCEREIRRGEAYELEPGTGGLVQHVHCPDLPQPDNQNGATA